MAFTTESPPARARSPQDSSSNGGCLVSYNHGPIFVHLSFSNPIIGTAVDMLMCDDTETIGDVDARKVHSTRLPGTALDYYYCRCLQVFLKTAVTGYTVSS